MTDLDVNPKPGEDGPTDVGPTWYRRWWFWTLVGSAVVAGCTVGLSYLLQPGPADTGYQVVVTRPAR